MKKRVNLRGGISPGSPNIGTLSVEELFFQLIGWLGVELGVN